MPDSNVRWLVNQRAPLPSLILLGSNECLRTIAANSVPEGKRRPMSCYCLIIRHNAIYFKKKRCGLQRYWQVDNLDRSHCEVFAQNIAPSSGFDYLRDHSIVWNRR